MLFCVDLVFFLTRTAPARIFTSSEPASSTRCFPVRNPALHCSRGEDGFDGNFMGFARVLAGP